MKDKLQNAKSNEEISIDSIRKSLEKVRKENKDLEDEKVVMIKQMEEKIFEARNLLTDKNNLNEKINLLEKKINPVHYSSYSFLFEFRKIKITLKKS